MATVANYYQVEKLKSACAEFLKFAPASVSRLVLAEECSLAELRERFVERIAMDFDDHDLEPLKEHTSLLMLVVKRAREKHASQKRKLLECTQENLASKVKLQKLQDRKAVLLECAHFACGFLPQTMIRGTFSDTSHTSSAFSQGIRAAVEGIAA